MAGATVVRDSGALVEGLAKSGLFTADVLAGIREQAAAQPDVKLLARDLVKEGKLTRWQAAQLLHGFYLLVVGKYRLLDQLGSGETGRVYLAEHAQMGRRHALKVLSRRLTSRPELLKRFLADAQRICALDHRNLSHCYDVNQDGDKYYLVMEYVEGQDLARLVASVGPLPRAKAIDYALQAIEGLSHAYERQVVHGDLKPTNLMVDAGGTLKIADIGQGRLIESSAAAGSSNEETAEAAAFAAAIYRAPEVRGGGAADGASDIYSLGNVLCFLLAGKAAVDAADAQAIVSSSKEASPELADLVGRMLAADPAQRPTLEEVGQELAAIAQAPAAPAAAPAVTKAKKPIQAKALPAAEEEAAPAAESPISGEDENPPESESEEANPLAGLAGLNFQPQPRRTGGRPVAKPVVAKAAPAVPEGAADSAQNGNAKKGKSRTPLIIGAAIGGGVLVLGGILAVVLMNWGGGEDVAAKAVAKAKPAAKKAETKADDAATEAMLDAVLGETNPTPPPAEANPEPATPPVAPAAETKAPADGPDAAKPADAPVPAAAEAGTKTEPAKTEPPKTDVAKTEPAAAEPKPEPKPAEKPQPDLITTAAAPPPPDAVKAAEAAKPAAAPKPAEAQLFKGLPTAINLPALAPEMNEASAAALTAFEIGPCPPDATAQLRGGDGAIRGGKFKFELVEASDVGSIGSWQFEIQGGASPLPVATLSVQDKKLTFQWTEAGAKHESAACLGNCKLVLTAGTERHELALREALQGDALLIDFDKPKSEVRWTLENLPDPRKIVVEVSRLGEAFGPHTIKNSPLLTSTDESNVAWLGAAETAQFIGIKFTSSVTAKQVKVESAGQIKIGDGTKPLLARTLKSLANEIDKNRFGLITQEKFLDKQKPSKDPEKQALAAQKELVKAQQDALNAQHDSLNQMQQLVAELKDKSEVFFRVYYQTDDDAQIDLVVTDHNPQPKKEEPKAAAKAKK